MILRPYSGVASDIFSVFISDMIWWIQPEEFFFMVSPEKLDGLNSRDGCGLSRKTLSTAWNGALFIETDRKMNTLKIVCFWNTDRFSFILELYIKGTI